MVSHRWMIAGLVAFLASGSPAMAGTEAKQISDRIKALREKLQTFREERGFVEKKTPDRNVDPAVLSDQLEHRSDAQMVVLFHDTNGEPQTTPNRPEMMDGGDGERKSESDKSRLDQAFERIRSLAEMRRKADERRGMKLAGK